MIKVFIQKNIYFIIGCLLIIIIMALFSKNYNSTNIEGFSYNIIPQNYNIKEFCGTSWTPTYTSATFNFKNKNYDPIYMLNSNLDDITQLFKNYSETPFNIDCSNLLYTTTYLLRKPTIYTKYMYNNNAIEFNPSLITETEYVGSFYQCLRQMVNDTKPTIYFNYDSKNPDNIMLRVTIVNKKNSNNRHRFNIFLKSNDRQKIEEKIINSLSRSHSVYLSSKDITGFGFYVLPNTDGQKCNIDIYKNTGKTDVLTNQNVPNFTTLIDDLSNSILSMYRDNTTSGLVKKYNLMTTSSSVKYMYGTIDYGDNQDFVIVQI